MKRPEAVKLETTYPAAATGTEARFFGNLPQKIGKAPRSAKKVEMRFGEDSDGNSAVWITIVADDVPSPSPKTVNELAQYSNKLRDAVVKSGFGRWPYVEIKPE